MYVARLNETFRALTVAGLLMVVAMGVGFPLMWLSGMSVEKPAFMLVFTAAAIFYLYIAVTAAHRLEVDPEHGKLRATSLTGTRTFALDDVFALDVSVFFLRGYAKLRTVKGSMFVFVNLDGMSRILEGIRAGGGLESTTAI